MIILTASEARPTHIASWIRSRNRTAQSSSQASAAMPYWSPLV